MKVIGLVNRAPNSLTSVLFPELQEGEEICQVYEDLWENLDSVLHLRVPVCLESFLSKGSDLALG